MSKLRIVEDYLEAITDVVVGGEAQQFWPFSPGQVDSYFIDIFARDIFEKSRQNPEEFKKALSLLPPNLLRWFLLPFVILGLKLTKKYDGYRVTSQEMISFIETVREVLLKMVSSEPFCLDGQNIILTDERIKKINQNLNWFGVSERKVVNLLSLNLESYVWSIDFDLFAYAVIWHGPYSLPRDKVIFAKSFFDLNNPVWRLKQPYFKIDIFYLFNNPIDIRIDFAGHTVYKQKIWDQLVNVAVVVDGKNIKSSNELKIISQEFSNHRDKRVKIINSLSPEKIIRKAIEVYYYMFRNFFNYYKESWTPPKEVEQRLKKVGLKYWQEFALKENYEEPGEDFFKRLYDPRNDFTD